MDISKVLTLAFIFRFPLMFLQYWADGLHLPLLSTVILVIAYSLEVFILFYAITHNYFSFSKSGIFWPIFVIYTIYIIKDVIISPQLGKNDLVGAPSSLWGIFLFVIVLTIYASCSRLWLCKGNILSICKATALIVPVMMIVYFSQVGIVTYAMMDQLSVHNNDSGDLLPDTYVSGLVLARYVCLGFICNLFVYDRWLPNRRVSICFSLLIALICLFTMMITARRGPVVFTVLTTMIFFYYKHSFSTKSFITMLLVYIVIILSLQYIDFSGNIFSRFFERMFSVIDDGGSGRFGSKDSVYSTAISQIMKNPYLGTYFRLLHGDYIGQYPHNYILEFVMTFGALFTAPIVFLNIKSIIMSLKKIHVGNLNSFWGVFLLMTSLRLLASDSPVNNMEFWAPLAISASFCHYKDKLNVWENH